MKREIKCLTRNTLSLIFCIKWGSCNTMLENKFKTELINEIETLFPGCMIFHLDPNERQGIPDLIILYKNKWAALEGKRNAKASCRPNQGYYINKMNSMSFASFIYPENKEEVLYELQQTFGSSRTTRLSRSKHISLD